MYTEIKITANSSHMHILLISYLLVREASEGGYTYK